MMINHKTNIQNAALLGLAIFFTSCQTDTEAPTVCTGLGAMNSITADEIEAEAGDHLDIEAITKHIDDSGMLTPRLVY